MTLEYYFEIYSFCINKKEWYDSVNSKPPDSPFEYDVYDAEVFNMQVHKTYNIGKKQRPQKIINECKKCRFLVDEGESLV